jgi:hypothetical protein
MPKSLDIIRKSKCMRQNPWGCIRLSEVCDMCGPVGLTLDTIPNIPESVREGDLLVSIYKGG